MVPTKYSLYEIKDVRLGLGLQAKNYSLEAPGLAMALALCLVTFLTLMYRILHERTTVISTGCSKKWKPGFNLAITSVNVHRFNHFYCYNKKCMTHKSKITPLTSPLFCNPLPSKTYTTANVNATFSNV